MKAIVLAAGLGTRLKPITGTIPKALIKIDGIPLLQILFDKLLASGFNEIGINAHHHADQLHCFIDEYETNNNVNIVRSYEPEILDTGGGIKKLLNLFNTNEPVLVHNVDILSSISFDALMQYHKTSLNIVTLVVQKKATTRYLLFNREYKLCGFHNTHQNLKKVVRDSGTSLISLNFCGIQVVQPQIFTSWKEKKFSSIQLYLVLAGQNQNVAGFLADDIYWRDVGTPDDLEAAEQDVSKGRLTV